MTPERVLQHGPLVLTQRDRERYFEDGCLTLPGYVGAGWLERHRAGSGVPSQNGDVLPMRRRYSARSVARRGYQAER
jgi:hypothetical protein